MPTSYTSLLGLALPVTGELSGTWGDTVNSYITQYVDAAVAGAQTISGSQTAVTLSVTNGSSLSQAGSGATGSAQYQIINCTGNPASALTVTVPSASKVYLVLNNTSTNQTVTVKGAATTGVTVAAARCALIAWNGTDFELVATDDASKMNGVLAAVNGGTGQSSYAVGDILYASTTTALSKLADVATGNALISGGVGVAPSYGKIGLTTHVSGTLPIANGGTNATATPTAGAIAYGTGTAYAFNTAGSSGQPLLSGGSGAPTFGTLSVGAGGTGQTSYTDGQLLIGNTATTSLSKATLTAGSGVSITNGNGSITISATGTGGTVTSVGQTFTGGLISVSGSPVTTSGTLALTVAGTSGGIPYFSSASTWASSAALAANSLVIGGGAGVAPSTTTTGTGVLTALGTNVGSAGAFVVNGGALGTPSSGTVTNLTGTASISINGTVGATTPSTGAFTTLTSSGGSSFATSAGNVGVGTSSPGAKLDVRGTDNTDSVRLSLASNTNGAYQGIQFVAGIYTKAAIRSYSTGTTDAGSLTFWTAPAGDVPNLRATIDSAGNFGIGVSSPADKLSVSGAARLTADGSSVSLYTGAGWRHTGSSGLYIDANSGGAANSVFIRNGSGFTTQLTLDGSGNLGLGVTPSAWSSDGNLQLKGGRGLAFGGAGGVISSNAYFNAGWKYISTGTAAKYDQDQTVGAHYWYTAASGTAGNPISFTQAMTLTAQGNELFVGTTSGFNSTANRGNISVNGSSESIIALGSGGTRRGYLYAYSTQMNVGSDGILGFETGGTERARITSGGNVSIGGSADRGTTVGSAALQLFNGTAPAGTLTNGVSLYSSSGDLNFMNSAGNGFKVGYRNLPPVGTQTGSYTLAAGDVGKYVQVSTGGSITIPTSVFAEGDAISIYNNTTGNITITCSAPTAYIAGTNTVKTSMTLATRGVATVLFYSATACVVSGNVT